MAQDRPRRASERRLPAALAAAAAAAMVWSMLSPAPLRSQEEPIQEPESLSSYATFADAAPMQLYFDHQTRFVPLGPALAHSQSEVSLPSQASAIAWLVDGGTVNGIHGTSTGARVPTEASAQQPGGNQEEEFRGTGGPIGHGDFAEVRAGRSYATATHGNEPRGYGNAFFGNIVLFPAPGSPEDPPGTFDPNASFPGGEAGETDPAPRGQMAILSIGHMASTSESIREGGRVISTGVAELKDINIGNRTADNRCTNCIRIDSIRVEAYAHANGSKGGSEAAYRVTLGRACRRAFNAEEGREEDQCLPLDPASPQSDEGLQQVDGLEQINDAFADPIWTEIPGAGVNYIVGVEIHAGDEHREPSRENRTSSPPEDPHRNYAYPDTRPKDPDDPSKGEVRPDRDSGEVAKAVAEGPDIQIWTITVSQVHDDTQARIKGTPAEAALAAIDEDEDQSGIQISGPSPVGSQTIPTNTIRSVRRLQLTLGVARANAIARGAIVVPAVSAGGGTGGTASGAPSFGGGTGAGAQPAAPAGVGGFGPFKLALDWSSFGISPWAPYDIAKALGLGLIAWGAYVLLRRRLRPG